MIAIFFGRGHNGRGGYPVILVIGWIWPWREVGWTPRLFGLVYEVCFGSYGGVTRKHYVFFEYFLGTVSGCGGVSWNEYGKRNVQYVGDAEMGISCLRAGVGDLLWNVRRITVVWMIET